MRYHVVYYINNLAMKKVTLYSVLIVLAAVSIGASTFTPTTGVFAQLDPSNHKKVVIQMVPDKTYEKVVVYVNFYSKDNKRLAQKAYSVSDEKDKYVRKGVCTTRVFKYSVDGDVSRVKIDHVNEGEVLKNEDGDNSGKKIAIPVASAPLEPIK